MIPFTVELRPGSPINEQLVYAIKKAVVSGQLRPGDRMPSVRGLSQELKINPNTVQKVVAKLVGDGLLEIRPGIGCSVAAAPPEATAAQRDEILQGEVERLVVEAQRLRLDKADIIKAFEEHWSRLADASKGNNKEGSGR